MTLALVGIALTLAAFVWGAVLTGVARTIAPQFGLVDKPGGRKTHKAPTPLGGGVAIWLTTVSIFVVGGLILWLGRGSLPPELAVHASGLLTKAGPLALILGLGSLIMLMGLADDRFGLSWKPRLAVQLGLATILVVVGGLRVTLFPPFSSPILTGLLTIVWIAGLTNSFNFLDNMDGLAAGVGLIVALIFAAAQIAVGSLFVPAVLLVLVGALGGFLLHNRYPAKIFMGDAGSNFLGFTLGALTVAGTFTRDGYAPYGVLTPLLVMAVPLYDTISVIIIRIREGRSPFQPDRRHFSHRLVDRGLTAQGAVRTINLVTLACGLGAILLHQLDAVGACLVVAQTICLIGVVTVLEFGASRPLESKAHVPVESQASPNPNV